MAKLTMCLQWFKRHKSIFMFGSFCQASHLAVDMHMEKWVLHTSISKVYVLHDTVKCSDFFFIRKYFTCSTLNIFLFVLVVQLQPAMKLIQLSDDPWYTGLLMKIHIIDPCQIIVPHTIYDAKPETCDGKLIKFIREEFPKLSLTKVPRRHFNETDGMEMIKKYCSEKYNFAKEEVESKYYALSAASGLLKYLQFVHNVFFKENGLKLEVETKFAHMQIGE